MEYIFQLLWQKTSITGIVKTPKLFLNLHSLDD
jgi:hypothetical protein